MALTSVGSTGSYVIEHVDEIKVALLVDMMVDIYDVEAVKPSIDMDILSADLPIATRVAITSFELATPECLSGSTLPEGGRGPPAASLKAGNNHKLFDCPRDISLPDI